MGTFAVIAGRATPTNTRLGAVLSPARAITRLRPGDVALGRLDVLPSLDGVEPGLWALDLLERRGVTVFNKRPALATAHDKLATAGALFRCALPHPQTEHVAAGFPLPELDFPVVLKPRFGSWGRDVVRCDTAEELAEAVAAAKLRIWFNDAGGVLQRLVEPAGFDLRVLVARGRAIGAVKRVAREGEWRTNVALGARRVPAVPPPAAIELALEAAKAVGGDLVGVDLLPIGNGEWTILEINGAVDFTGAYSLGGEVFSAVRAALLTGAEPFAEPSTAAATASATPHD